MNKYYCEKCNSYVDGNMRDKNTNKCTICGTSCKSKSEIYWCKHCNVPIYDVKCDCCGNEAKYISTDLKPVFLEEKILLTACTDDTTFLSASCWLTSNNKYIVNGKQKKYSRKDIVGLDADSVTEKYNHLMNTLDISNLLAIENKILSDFVKCNKKYLNNIKSEAILDIQQRSSGYEDDEMFISFSGGKDSTVVSDLVIKALAGRRVTRIFGDTTLEFEETYDYVRNEKDSTVSNEYSPIITSRNRKDKFSEICEIIGPPSRVMRWCCTYFKTSPISDKIDRLFEDNKKVLSFHGIRRAESTSRSKYDMETDSPKISKQKVLAPIIDWLDFDVWLYILGEKISYNKAYRLGFTRVGCWCCPNNSSWSEFLSRIHHPEKSNEWRNQLIRFAKKTNKSEPEKYVDEGSWKARQGGAGLKISENSFVSFTPCVNEADSFSYELTKPISNDLYELFKPFGQIDVNMGNKLKGEVFVVDKNLNPLIRLQGRLGTRILKITIFSTKLGGLSRKIKNIKDAKRKIECQLVKYQICTGCLGCKSACKHDAVVIIKNGIKLNDDGEMMPDIKYMIDDNKCVKCGECVDHYDNGCYMKKVFRIKQGVK